jgi:hypothetical protein
MKAVVYMQIHCPACKSIMRRDESTDTVFCEWPRCDLRGKRFQAPTVDLKPVSEFDSTIKGDPQ